MEAEKHNRGLSAAALKLIALIIMTIDHIAAYGMKFSFARENYWLMRRIGRVAAPLFLFAFTESLRHTSDRRRFFFRIYKASVAVGLCNAFLGCWLGYSFGNIFQTFAWIAAAVFCTDAFLERGEKNGLLKIMAIAAFSAVLDKFICSPYFGFEGGALARDIIRAFLPSPVYVEYSLGMIALGVVWYYVNNKLINAALLFAISLPSFFGFYSMNPALVLVSGSQSAMAAAVPFILLYNGERGNIPGRLFYIYYPVHVYIIALINRLI